MSQSYDPVLFSVNLACNFFLLGGLISGGVFLAFKLIKNANPRFRYIVAVILFLLTAFLPFAVTSGVFNEFGSSIEASKTAGGMVSYQLSGGQSFVETTTVPAISDSAAEKNFSETLNRFTDSAAASFAGKIFFGVWIFGIFAFLLRDVCAFLKIRRECKIWREATETERKTLDVTGNLPLFFGSKYPMTTGFFKPLIVLPEDFPDGLTLAQKRAIVRHEAAHALWRDPLAGFILHLVSSVFWINPWLRYFEQIAVAERESAADQAAIGMFSGNEAEHETAVSDYAAMLVSMAKHLDFNCRHNSFGVSATALYSGSILENRIRRIFAGSSKTNRFRAFAATFVFAFSFVGLFFLPVAIQSENFSYEIQETSDQNSDLNNLENSQFQNYILMTAEPGKSEKLQKPEVVELKKTSENTAATDSKSLQIPYVVSVRKTAQNSDEIEMRKLSEQDARAAGFDKKLDELSKKVQGLDALRKNLESDIPKVRQKAASQIDSLMQKNQTTVNTNGNINQNINININQQ